MNTQPTPSEDPLEALLHKSPVPLPDDGFSARVLAALPPPVPKPRTIPNRRAIAYSLGALTGLVWAIVRSGPPHASDLGAFYPELQTSASAILNALGNPTVLVLCSLILASITLAFSREIAAKLG